MTSLIVFMHFWERGLPGSALAVGQHMACKLPPPITRPADGCQAATNLGGPCCAPATCPGGCRLLPAMHRPWGNACRCCYCCTSCCHWHVHILRISTEACPSLRSCSGRCTGLPSPRMLGLRFCCLILLAQSHSGCCRLLCSALSAIAAPVLAVVYESWAAPSLASPDWCCAGLRPWAGPA